MIYKTRKHKIYGVVGRCVSFPRFHFQAVFFQEGTFWSLPCPYQEKMLDIIQFAFGDLGKFNDSVRSILHAIDWMRSCPREWIASPLSQTSDSMAFAGVAVSPKTPSVFPAVPDDSPVPSLPSPRGKATRRQRSPATLPVGRPWPGSPISLTASSPVPSIGLPEDSPVPSMPSPKEYQWLN